jgi:tape measure domain-containing protein
MAYDGSIKIDTSIDEKGLKSGLSNMASSAKSGLSKIASAAKTAICGMTKLVGGAGGALAAGATAGVKYNAQMEQYITSFGTMLGGANKAQELVSQLKKYAADTPFEFKDLAKGSQTLLSFGVSANNLMPTLKMLGDVSQGNTERFDALSLAFGQVSSAGKMSGQDLLQFINAGFNPLNEMAKKSGKSMAELRDEMSKGEISAQDVSEAFQSATSKGGQFYNAMAAQSKTFSGQLSTLKDNAMQFLGDITTGFTNTLKDTALPMVNGWLSELQTAFSSGGISGVVSTLGTVLSQAFTAVAQQAPGIINMAVSLIQSFLLGIQQNLPQITAAASQIITSLAEGIGTVLPQLILTAADIITALANDLAANPQPIADAAVKIITALVQGLIQAAPALANAAVSLAKAFFSGLQAQHPAEVPLVGAVLAALSVEKFKGPVSGIIKEIKKIPGAFDNAKSGIGTLAQTIGTTLWSGLQKIGAFIAANPFILVIAAITAVVAAIIYLWNTNEGFRNAVIGTWNAISGAVQTVWGAICSFFTVTIPGAWNSLVAIFNAVPAWWNGLWTQVGQFFTTCWNEIVGFFTVTIPTAITAVGQWFAQLPYLIGYALGLALGSIINFGINIWNWVTTQLPQIITGIVNWFAQLPGRIWAWLVNTVTNIVTWGQNMYASANAAASHAISAVINWFAKLPGRIWAWLVNTIQRISAWGSSMYASASAASSRTISAVVGWFQQLPGRIWGFLSSVIGKIGAWGGSMASKGAAAAKQLFDSVVNGIKGLPRAVMDIGSNIVRGIWNGISGAAGWLAGKVKGFASGILSGMKAALGIHSPSKLFADEVGKFIPPGINVGIDAAMPDTIRKMRQQAASLMESARATIEVEQAKAARVGIGYSGGTYTTIDKSVTTSPIVFKGNYSFGNKSDINYFMNQAALLIRRKQ